MFYILYAVSSVIELNAINKIAGIVSVVSNSALFACKYCLTSAKRSSMGFISGE